MTAAELWAAWQMWMMVAGALVLVTAALLMTIWLAARSIVAHARRALQAAEAIRDNTRAIWELQTTNEVAGQLLDTVRAIEAKATKLVVVLEGHAVTSGRTRSKA